MPTSNDASSIGSPSAALDSPAVEKLITFADAVAFTLEHFGGLDSGAQQLRQARRAVVEAYRELCQSHQWSYFEKKGPLITTAAQTSGTAAYDHTGGAAERLVTLTDATFPDDVSHMSIRISGATYPIFARLSSTTATLREDCNPGEDLAAQSYSLFQAEYPLPSGVRKIGDLIPQDRQFTWPTYVSPQDGLALLNSQPEPRTDPWRYTIRGSAYQLGVKVIEFFPPPLTARKYEYIAEVSPQPLKHFGGAVEYSTGTVTVSAGSAAVTGVGTAWTDDMTGCLMRFPASGETDPPNGLMGVAGGNATEVPYVEQHSIAAVNSATSITLASEVENGIGSATAYTIGSPIDIDVDSLLDAFYRLCEWKMSRKMPDRFLPKSSDPARVYQQEYIAALRRAKADDYSRHDPFNQPPRYVAASLTSLYPQ